MKKVLIDENLPVSLRHYLPECEVVTVRYQGWTGIKNGELMNLIDGKFDVFLTADKNLRYQQNLKNRTISIIELPLLQRRSIPLYISEIKLAILTSISGSYLRILA